MTQFEWFDFQDQHQAKIKEIQSKPIVLKLGKYECWVENESIHYSKWVKKQRDFISYDIIEPIQTYEIHGGIGNKLICTWKKQIIYRDKNGNEFTELEYWDNEKITKKEFLDNSTKT